MARVYLDTNYFIDAIERQINKNLFLSLSEHAIYVSTLSYHVFFYASKKRVPDEKIKGIEEETEIVDFGKNILEKALSGPTSDLEDNIQLHSAAEAECDYFLTLDKKLLSMKFFGKTRIISNF